MKTIITVLTGLLALGVTLEPEEHGYGSCFEARPICIQGAPVCMCTVTNYCFWACR